MSGGRDTTLLDGKLIEEAQDAVDAALKPTQSETA